MARTREQRWKVAATVGKSTQPGEYEEPVGREGGHVCGEAIFKWSRHKRGGTWILHPGDQVTCSAPVSL